MAQYEVIGPVAVVRYDNKSERYLYKGAVFEDAGVSAESIKHLTSVKLIAERAAASPSRDKDDGVDEGPYKGVSVKDLKSEVEKRNQGREDTAKVSPSEPGNRAEIVAALLADDAKQASA